MLNIVPTNIFGPLTSRQFLPIIFFPLFFPIPLSTIPQKPQPLNLFLSPTLQPLFSIINNILKLPPIPLFPFISTTIITFPTSPLI
ncbi:cation:dicarboxylate symporter family transporter, partial [Staphylococcus saprophyticus]|uniref:cation:dicarboxylate symporter family transporter n=1 Tax=Staphylococcus saprophyticus TaxID=29385 RepID=UPI0037047D2C